MYSSPPPTEMYTFVKKKAYQTDKTLVYPTESFVALVEDVKTIFACKVDKC